jgi:hypothetical protein
VPFVQNSRPPINSNVKGKEKNWMKGVPCLEKGTGAFLYRVVLKLKCIEYSIHRQPSRPPRTSFMLGFAGRTEHAGRFTRSASALVSMLPAPVKFVLSSLTFPGCLALRSWTLFWPQFF